MTHNAVVIRYGFSLHKKAFYCLLYFNVFYRIVPRIIMEIGLALRVLAVVSIRAKSLIPIALTNPPYSIQIGIRFYASAKLALLI